MKTLLTFCIATLTILIIAKPLSARESLYKIDRSPLAPELASAPGDLLTIIVEEMSSAIQSGNNKTETKAEHDFELKKFFFPGFKINQGFDDIMGGGESPGFGISTENDFMGSATNNSSHIITTKIQAQIVEIVSPGQFIIQAQKSLDINDKTKDFLISGTIRYQDIETDNTICSELIANAFIEIDGEIAGKDIQPNILSRIFTSIF